MMEGLRLAALKLHGVGPADRAWILGRLDPDARERLQTLLRDLQRTGIEPAQVEAIQGEIAGKPPARDEPAPPRGMPAQVAAQLEHADAERVARILKGEPEWVWSAILAAHPWTWGAAVRERLGAGALGSEPRLAPELQPSLVTALLRSLAQRVEGQAGAAESSFDRVMDNLDPLVRSGRSGFWKKVRTWIP
jgi:hypothetical protein